MERYRGGELGAFETLYARHGGKVFGYLMKHLNHRQRAEEVFQLVFLKFHESRHRYDPQFPVLPWLFSITRNALVDEIRKKGPLPVEADELERHLGGTAEQVQSQVEESLERALQLLPKEQGELLRLRFQEGLSFEEISLRLGAKAPALRKRVSRALEQMRRQWKGEP